MVGRAGGIFSEVVCGKEIGGGRLQRENVRKGDRRWTGLRKEGSPRPCAARRREGGRPAVGPDAEGGLCGRAGSLQGSFGEPTRGGIVRRAARPCSPLADYTYTLSGAWPRRRVLAVRVAPSSRAVVHVVIVVLEGVKLSKRSLISESVQASRL